jgi:hypothetical protein
MAGAYRTSVVFGNTTSGTNPSGAITPAVGDFLLVVCQAVGNANTTPTCADGNTGGTYTRIGTALSNASANTLSYFVRDALVPNTTSTTVTVTIGAHTACEVTVYAFSGCPTGGISAIVQSASQANQAGGTTPAPTFSSLPSLQNIIFSAVGNITNPAGVTGSAGSDPTWTLDQNAGQTGCGLCSQHANSQLPRKVVTWGSTSATAFASVAIEIAAEPTTIGVDVTKLVSYGVTAPPTGVDTSKLVAYALPAPPIGVAASKLVAYALPAPPIGVAASKLVAYAVLNATNTNPPVWPSLTFPNGYLGNPYLFGWDLTPAASPTTYTLNSGALPTGLSLHSPSADLGNVSGTPTVLGVFTFTLKATNTFGSAISPTYTITITTPTGGAGGSFTFIG